MAEPTKTLCPYCGVGCGLEVMAPAQPGKAVNRDKDGTPIWFVRGDRTHPSSQGMVCVKGATIAESLHKDRLRYPMMRESLDQPFRQVSWDDAIVAIVNRIQVVRFTQGPDAICMYGSGQFQTEDYYIAQKLIKGCLGTNNFDANSRLCMSSAVSGYIQSFGADGPPCCYDDLDETDCAFLIGTNTAECHPILYNRLRKHHKKHRNVKLVVVDPRRTATADGADLHLAIKPGTDIDLMNGIAYLLWRWHDLDHAFIETHTNGFDQFVEVIRHYPPPVVAERCGISEADLSMAAHFWARSQRILSMWSMGVNQSSEGTAKVRSIINLHLMTGQIGKPGAGPFSLTGQPNAMGGREAGGLSHLLPGYRTVQNAQHREDVERFWGLPPGKISPSPGRTAWEMILGLEMGEVGLFWVAATNPAVSMPDLERTKAALKRSPFTIYQDCYTPTEMVDYAHILLPAAQWSEKTGVMTNSERRITLCSQFRTPPGEAKPDWLIFAEVGRRLGFAKQFAYNYSAEVYKEFARLTQGQPCDQSELSHTYLFEHGATQWANPAAQASDLPEKPGLLGLVRPAPAAVSSRLYVDHQFHTPDKRARFGAYHSRGLAEPPDDRYPFVLTTGRLYGHWHTQSRTGRIEKLRVMHPNPFIEIHPKDAEKLGVKSDEWVEVRSRRGMARFPVLVTKAIAPGTVFVPMHWGALWADQAEANALTHAEACPDSRQPELKACAVEILPISAEVVAQAQEFEPSLVR
ncbi:molybdopterin oxidoreductase family protein [Myxacorys almedinensis]|uniref:Molybdopterin-dependent oxidoreductase n=1 Tax=Myxacorys almedinensis A TaxID=2690445 RepID=A0A8J7Z3E5_9CYAN|nr:nitrate reductase [Myxacorys almedinensis]NDJ19274.1 molybdopterin-dependent oxidoreductase [Myxacorys almedinensis A]